MNFLKPCPFCGGYPMMTKHDSGLYDIHCNKCGVSTIAYANISHAINAWNNRTSGIFEREQELYTFASQVANGYFLDYESVIDEAEKLVNKYELGD